MITSKEDKYRIIYGYEKFNDLINNINIIKSVPMMIRNNGLFNTIIYLHDNDKAIGIYQFLNYYYGKYLDKDNKQNLLEYIFNVYNEEDVLYRKYTYESYELTMVLTILLKKDGDKGAKSKE